jgi:hypothetical protein
VAAIMPGGKDSPSTVFQCSVGLTYFILKPHISATFILVREDGSLCDCRTR